MMKLWIIQNNIARMLRFLSEPFTFHSFNSFPSSSWTNINSYVPLYIKTQLKKTSSLSGDIKRISHKAHSFALEMILETYLNREK